MSISGLLERAKTGGTEVPDDPRELSDDGLVDLGVLNEVLDDDLLEPDPKPGPAQKAKGIKPPKAPLPSKATAAQKRQVQDMLELALKFMGAGVSLRDGHCGGAINEQSQAIAKACVPLVARNPQVLAWFVGGTGFMDWLGLLMALQPVVGTVWGHHITHTVGGEDEEDGVDYSAFTAPSFG